MFSSPCGPCWRWQLQKTAKICSRKWIICSVFHFFFFLKDNQSGVVRLGQGRKVGVAHAHANVHMGCIIDAQSNTSAQRLQIAIGAIGVRRRNKMSSPEKKISL